MIKKLFSIALVAVAVSANAQQIKVKPSQARPVNVLLRGANPSVLNTIDTLRPASVMPGGCAVGTNTAIAGLYNYINDVTTPNDSGYIFGTGIIPIGGGQSTVCQELAQKYNVTGAATVTDVLVLAGAAHGGTVTTTAKVYTEAATTHKPNTLLGTSNAVAMSAYSTTGYTAFHFATPVAVSAGNFFASVTVPAFGGADQDTLSILSTMLGSCPPAGSDSCSALKLGAPINSWYLVKVGFGVNGDLMIFPVISIASGINSVTKGDLSLSAVSPNPATGSINVNFSINNPSKVDIEVMDMTGKMVKSVKGAETLTNGKHVITVDVSNLEAGSYMYSIQACGTKMFSKFVIAK